MKTRLLKKLRRNAYLERRNSEYRAILESGMFRIGMESSWMTKKEAECELRRQIIFVANWHFKRGKTKIK